MLTMMYTFSVETMSQTPAVALRVKSDWRCTGHFPPALAYSPPANGKHGAIPEKMFQTLLTNKKHQTRR